MYWHPQGDYLAAKVERFTKTKKSTFTGFELFSIRDKDIPMEVSDWSWIHTSRICVPERQYCFHPLYMT